MQANSTDRTKLEVLELCSQNSLDVLRVDSKDVGATEVADGECSDIAFLLITNDLDPLLGQLRYYFGLVCYQGLFQVIDSKRIFRREHWHTATTQALSMS